jgi:hypothetical protein
LEFGIWDLGFGIIWNLEFGIWNLEIGNWDLEFGIWNWERFQVRKGGLPPLVAGNDAEHKGRLS